MANIKSAKKRIKTIDRKRTENKLVKSTLSTKIKGFKKLLSSNQLEQAKATLVELTSMIDSAASKGVFHKNNASRKISRLNLAYNKAAAKTETEAK